MNLTLSPTLNLLTMHYAHKLLFRAKRGLDLGLGRGYSANQVMINQSILPDEDFF